jgi:hypothetical protein
VQVGHFAGGVDWVEADASDLIGWLVHLVPSYGDHSAKYFDYLVGVQQVIEAVHTQQAVSVVQTAVAEVQVRVEELLEPGKVVPVVRF